MNITILYYLESEDAKEHDPVVDQVADALRQGKHKPSLLGVHSDVNKLIRGLNRRKPDLVFNLLETFGESQLGAVAAVGLLELLGLRFTGGGPGEYYLQEDKALTKKLLAFDGIAYPDFAVFGRDAGLETGGNLRMPLFVKPLRMDASIGIGVKSLVHSTTEMMKRVLEIHEQVKDAALAEEYIAGREFYVGVLGNGQPRAFPPVEMDFSGLPDGQPRVVDAKAKWDPTSPEYQGTRAVVPDLAEEVRARLQKVALEAYRALRVRDYGRIDLRLTDTGDIYVIEVNASCYLEQEGEFVQGARAAGLDYPDLINQIVNAAWRRYEQPIQEVRRRPRRVKHAKTAAT
jgi:D-alanine-D-alanine ligase